MASKFDSSQLYTCENCGKSFQTNESLKDHETTHKEVPSPCDICNKVYKSNKQLKHHKSTVHTENTFTCNECPTKFSTTSNLRRHIKTFHEKEFIDCSICEDKILSTKLNRHKISCAKKNGTVFVDVEEKKEKTYSCKKCDKVFSFKHALVSHERYYHKKNQCNICNIELNSSLQRHINTVPNTFKI